MKTAMQELIEWLDKELKYKNDTISWFKINGKITKLLIKEKQQIIDSYNRAKWDNINEESIGGGEDYFDKIYNEQIKQ